MNDTQLIRAVNPATNPDKHPSPASLPCFKSSGLQFDFSGKGGKLRTLQGEVGFDCVPKTAQACGGWAVSLLQPRRFVRRTIHTSLRSTESERERGWNR